MESLTKLTLYDLLAIFLPGGLIIISFFILCNYLPINELFITNKENSILTFIKSDEWISIIFLILLSYIIGLLNNTLNNVVFKRFRNNRWNIEAARLNIQIMNTPKSPNNQILKDKRKRIRYKNSFLLLNKRNPKIHIKYYSIYYQLLHENLIGDIPIIEAQVALLRNVQIPLLLIFLLLAISKLIISAGFCILLTIFSYFTMTQLQNKIYEIIWEKSIYFNIE